MSNAPQQAKTPFWKKKWFWITVAVILVIGGIGNALDGDKPQSTPTATIPTPAETTQSVETPQSEPEEQKPEATTGGLENAEAMTACDSYGQDQFPYGYAPHWIVGLINNELDTTNDEWDFKFTADVTNAFNAEREVTIECSVTGSNESPSISHFDAY